MGLTDLPICLSYAILELENLERIKFTQIHVYMFVEYHHLCLKNVSLSLRFTRCSVTYSISQFN